jgi:serine/threonine-protein kinase
MDLEWEKAARGVDDRPYPWGRRRGIRWANLLVPGSAPSPAPVDSFPLDESPYGVRGVAGNASDWVTDAYQPLGPDLPDSRVIVVDPTPARHPAAVGINRGGTYGAGAQSPHLAVRDVPSTDRMRPASGFRVARSVGVTLRPSER